MSKVLCIFLIVFLNPSGYQNSPNKKIQVTGKAYNAKAGAVVAGADKITYYLDGLESWDKKFYGKKVRVSGTLFLQSPVKHNPNDQPKQEFIGIKRTIRKPRWELVN